MADYQFKINSLSFKCSDQPIVPKKINVIIYQTIQARVAR